MKCRICGRDATTDFCAYHRAAKEKVESEYALWVNAYGKLEWKDYLDSVKRSPQTGQWAKEIAELLGGN
jgi:hypothetical protein